LPRVTDWTLSPAPAASRQPQPTTSSTDAPHEDAPGPRPSGWFQGGGGVAAIVLPNDRVATNDLALLVPCVSVGPRRAATVNMLSRPSCRRSAECGTFDQRCAHFPRHVRRVSVTFRRDVGGRCCHSRAPHDESPPTMRRMSPPHVAPLKCRGCMEKCRVFPDGRGDVPRHGGNLTHPVPCYGRIVGRGPRLRREFHANT
jgi:hypothetical protein